MPAPQGVSETDLPGSEEGELRATREALVVRHMELEERGDAAAVVATFAEPRYDLVATGQVLIGADAVARRVRDLAAAMPGATIEPVTLRHADDAVIVETRIRGIHSAPLLGVAPTGRSYDIRGVAIFRFEGQRLIDEIVYHDRLTLIEQLSQGQPARTPHAGVETVQTIAFPALSATPVTAASLDAAIEQIRALRDRGVHWLLEHIDPDGTPVGAAERNGWGRVPWALAVSGESAAAARVIAWAERGQIGSDGMFAPGVALGNGRFGAYPLAHFAIGAWLTERFSVALKAMDALRRWQDPKTGGLSIAPPADRASDLYDLLSTAQVGLAAVITGQDDIADLCWRWVAELAARQPADAGTRLYTFRRGEALLTDPDSSLAWLAVTDFAAPRQTYYTPGMAAVFLTAYGPRRGLSEPVELARRLVGFNLAGCAAQFDDPDSVQACKFGWGAAALLVADPEGDWLPHVVRMGDWFARHQHADGAWAPSRFLAPEPSDVDKLVKTAEHVMEVNALLAALGTARGALC